MWLLPPYLSLSRSHYVCNGFWFNFFFFFKILLTIFRQSWDFYVQRRWKDRSRCVESIYYIKLRLNDSNQTFIGMSKKSAKRSKQRKFEYKCVDTETIWLCEHQIKKKHNKSNCINGTVDIVRMFASAEWIYNSEMMCKFLCNAQPPFYKAWALGSAEKSVHITGMSVYTSTAEFTNRLMFCTSCTGAII